MTRPRSNVFAPALIAALCCATTAHTAIVTVTFQADLQPVYPAEVNIGTGTVSGTLGQALLLARLTPPEE